MELIRLSVRKIIAPGACSGYQHSRAYGTKVFQQLRKQRQQQERQEQWKRSYANDVGSSSNIKQFNNKSPPIPKGSNSSYQAFPLSGYYKLILENPLTPSAHSAYYPHLPSTTLPKASTAKSTSVASDKAKKTSQDDKGTAKPDVASAEGKQFQRQAQLEKEERKELEQRAKIVFGSRLTGPQRREVMKSKAEYIAGVLVPPKPEEPDNCCMSGCVNCVWDLYRDDMEYWVAQKVKAQEAARKKSMVADTTSSDEDGGRFIGEQMLSSSYEGIPVGIRAFMETEKALKIKRAQEARIGTI